MGSGCTESGNLVAAATGALTALGPAAWAEAARFDRVELFTLVAAVCADQYGLPPLSGPPAAGRGTDGTVPVPAWRARNLGASDRALLEFAEQFSVDVSSVTDDQRSALVERWGPESATVVAVVFVSDFLPRVGTVLDALGRPLPVDDGPVSAPPIWSAFDRLIRIVPRLDTVDPVTSELVRLWGARQHRCRLCQSLRSRPAVLAGADERFLGNLDDYEESGLSPFQKAALALTDAMIWRPGHIDDVVDRVRSHASADQCSELVADVTRNALNKIAVALGADAAHVEDGIEIYDIDPDGELVYGLSVD